MHRADRFTQIDHGLVSFGHEHHEHAQRVAPAHSEKLEDAVKGGGVAVVRVDNREQVGERIAEDLAGERRLACAEPVDVSPERVELAVVGDHSEGLGEEPGGERVGTEALVKDTNSGLEVGIGKIGEVRCELWGNDEPLIDDRAGAEAAEVEGIAPGLGHTLLNPAAAEVE